MSLKEIRKNSGLSQQELAKKLGIAVCTLAHYESGIRKITLKMFLEILKICNLEIKLEEKSYLKVKIK